MPRALTRVLMPTPSSSEEEQKLRKKILALAADEVRGGAAGIGRARSGRLALPGLETRQNLLNPPSKMYRCTRSISPIATSPCWY